MSRHTHYSVHPRYTAGSGAQVDERTARKVAEEEKRGHEHALSGVWGDEEKNRADRLGLAGISEALTEVPKGWRVEDLCTGETYLRLKDKPRVGDEVIETAKSTHLFVVEIIKTHIGLAYTKGGTIAVVPRPDDFKVHFTIKRPIPG